MASDRHAPGRRTDGLEDRIVAALVKAQSEDEPDVAEHLLRALETLAALKVIAATMRACLLER
jgi:hypothetical protein